MTSVCMKYDEKAKNNDIQFDMATQQTAYVAGVMSKLNEKLNRRETSQKNIDLPKLKLPEFSGKATEWRSYIELFDTIVHTNEANNDAIKMQYLKTSIKGEAAKLIAHIAPTAENYKTCRDILEKRYNKHELVGKLIDAVLNLPKMRGETSEDLRKIHDTANECLLSIKNMGVETENWDPLVIHILLQKLSKETIKHYEFQLKDTREIQMTREFLAYLEMRFLAIKSSESNSSFTTVNVGSHPMKEKTIKCQFCGDDH